MPLETMWSENYGVSRAMASKGHCTISRKWSEHMSVNGFSRRQFLDSASGLALFGFAGPSHMQPQLRPEQTIASIGTLSKFIAAIRYDAIPAKALETAKIAIMDCLGVAVAGGREESAQISGRIVREEKAKEE